MAYVRANSSARISPQTSQITAEPTESLPLNMEQLNSGVPLLMVSYKFLGQRVCQKSWHLLTGVGRSTWVATCRRVAAGHVEYQRRKRQHTSFVMDSMHGALWCLIEYCQERMPLSRTHADSIVMPFHHPVQLFNMLKTWYIDSLKGPGVPMLPSAPYYTTFKKVIRRPEFSAVKFHRIVEMGRCPNCQWYAWRCMSCAPEHREGWTERATRHHLLQLQQKRIYSRDRSHAARGYPHGDELYIAMDCSSGHEFCLPHLAGADFETNSKALKDMTTLPLKVMNILIHGDSRAHVVLSPSTVSAVPLSSTCRYTWLLHG